MSMPIFTVVTTLLLAIVTLSANPPIDNAENQWPMASGPAGTWKATTKQDVPTRWSVSTGENIIWKTSLPEGGQSGIAVWGDRLFLSINEPLPLDTPLEETKGANIVAYCLDARNGEVLWTAPIEGSKESFYSGLFSDSSSPTPVTDGEHVWFVNAGGAIACFTMLGDQVWSKPFEVRTRHNAKQCEPILYQDQLLYVSMLDPDDPNRREMRADPGERNSKGELWPWMYVRSFNKANGAPLWSESSGTSVHNTPSIGMIDGKAYVYHIRGGGHKPPEKPYGASMTHLSDHRGQAGTNLWSYPSKNPFAYTVTHFDSKNAYLIEAGVLTQLDASSGKVVNTFPLFEDVTLRLWNAAEQSYKTHTNVPFTKAAKKFKPWPTNQSAILIGKYYLFMSHEGHCIGRVDTESGLVEYLQVPVQVIREPSKGRQYLWDSHLPSEAANSRGLPISNDPRSKGDGWGHLTLGNPIAVNQYVYFSNMLGMTYVIDSQAKTFDQTALVSMNDLGPAKETWSLSSPSYSQGRLYHRGLKYVVCIGDMTD